MYLSVLICAERSEENRVAEITFLGADNQSSDNYKKVGYFKRFGVMRELR
jgi:hypothetical protein